MNECKTCGKKFNDEDRGILVHIVCEDGLVDRYLCAACFEAYIEYIKGVIIIQDGKRPN